MEFSIALQFLTRVPVTIRKTVESVNIARAMAYFPLVGLLIGISTAAVHFLLSYVLAPQVCDLIAIAFIVIVTGNMHGDGLMDTADGIYSGRPRERILEIMRDSCVGSHGVMAGVLVLLAKFVLLGQLPPEVKSFSLILVPAIGRWAQVYGATVYPYARTGGGTGGFTDLVGKREIFWASLTVLVAAGMLFRLQGGVLAVAVLVGTLCIGRYISAKIGGMTGDTLGAMSELTEVLALFVIQFMF